MEQKKTFKFAIPTNNYQLPDNYAVGLLDIINLVLKVINLVEVRCDIPNCVKIFSFISF